MSWDVCLTDGTKEEKARKRESMEIQKRGTLTAWEKTRKDAIHPAGKNAQGLTRKGRYAVRQLRTMQSRGNWSPLFLSGTVFFITRSCKVRYFVLSGGIIGYKDGVLPPDGHASRRSQFAPVIVISNPFPFADAFFFKWIFPGEAARKILLKTGGNAAGKREGIFLWWKGKTAISVKRAVLLSVNFHHLFASCLNLYLYNFKMNIW